MGGLLGAPPDLARPSPSESCSAEVTEAFIERAEAVDATIGTYLERHRSARRGGSGCRRARDAGAVLSQVDGVPVAYKDIFSRRECRRRRGRAILEGWVPPYDATVVARCSGAGLPMLGKLRHGRVRDGLVDGELRLSARRGTRGTPTAVPGGSSAGPAALVAAGGAPWSWGTDTGGSVRQPAVACAGSSESSRPTGSSPDTGSSRSHRSLDQASAVRPHRGGRRHLAPDRGRSRPDGLDVDPGRRPQLPRWHRRRDQGDAHRRREGVRGAEGTQPGVRARVDEAYTRLEKLGASHRGDLPSVIRIRDLRVLPGRPRRGVVQPRSLRRGALRITERRRTTSSR